MQVFLVGGAVRDALLGLPVKDRDYLVVGATAAEMLAAGYKQVGRDFPVFLHPKTGEEYALARTERKNGRGYTGFSVDFSPEVTLEEDLRRRDLTINAIAQDSGGILHDPYGGVDDLSRRLLRHVSPAFAEDPLRVLRLMRFWARFAPLGFMPAEDTLALCRRMAESGELADLTLERVWNECSRALGYEAPAQFFDGLAQVGALAVICAEALPDAEQLQAMNRSLAAAAARTAVPEARFALWLAEVPHTAAAVKQRLPLPVIYKQWIDWVQMHRAAALQWRDAAAVDKYALLKSLGGLKTDKTLQIFADAVGAERALLCADAAKVRTITAAAVMAEGFAGAALGEALRRRQLAALC